MNVAFCLCFACFLAATALSLLRNMHMFQLNSYKAAEHLPWLCHHAVRLLPSLLLLVFAGLSLTDSPAVAWCAAVMLVLTALCNLPKKAKKPLKYTGRVVRMLVTAGLLAAAASVAAFFLPRRLGLLVLCAFCAIVPLLPLLANLINAPLEASVRRWYINDAKKLLRASPDLTVIGVTGSYGKTSVKFFLGTLLRARFNTLVTPENYNTPMGVVKTIRGFLRATHELFVCEMGAKYKGDIRELCRLVHPRFGVITSIGEQHLETFGSLEAIVRTKFEIYRELPDDGILFVNGDNATIMENLPTGGCRILTYGTGAGCDYRAEDISASRDGTTFLIRTPGGEMVQCTVRLLGTHNVVNLTGAFAVAAELGIAPAELAAQMRKITPVEHRLQLIEKQGLTVIDDAYNSNPAGCRAALETLGLFSDMKILVTPGMVELGALQMSCNREFGREAAAVCDYVVLVGAHQTEPIRAGLSDAGYPESQLFVAADIREALAHVNALQTEKRKIVLLENDLPDNY